MEPETLARLKTQIEEGERLAKIARTEIEKARKAEIDVSAQERDLAETERKLGLLRKVYITGK